MDQMQTVPGPSQAAFNTLNNQMSSLIKRVEVLTFNSTDVTQTATKTELIGYALVGYAISQTKFSYAQNHYISDLILNSETGEVTVTRTSAGLYPTSKLWVYAIKIPS